VVNSGKRRTDKSGAFRVLLEQRKLELEQTAARIEQMDMVIQQEARENESCQRLPPIPGVGPITAMALIAAVQRKKGARPVSLDGDRSGRRLDRWQTEVAGHQ
jgi:transposase